MKPKWIVTYRLNDKVHTVEHEFRTMAELEMIKLEAYGITPTLHFSDGKETEQKFVRDVYGI